MHEGAARGSAVSLTAAWWDRRFRRLLLYTPSRARTLVTLGASILGGLLDFPSRFDYTSASLPLRE